MTQIDQVIARMQETTFYISPQASQEQRAAVSLFLEDKIDFEELLNTLGFQRGPLLRRNRNHRNKIRRDLTGRTATQLRSISTKEFPEPIKNALKELDCPLLWISLPRTSKIVNDTEMLEGLFKVFYDDPYKLGLILGEYFLGRHDITPFFNSIANKFTYQARDSSTRSETIKLFSAGFFVGLRRVPKDQYDFILQSLEPNDIIGIAEMLEGVRGISFGTNNRTSLKDLDKDSFLAISARINEEDTKRNNNEEISTEIYGLYNQQWDQWLALRLRTLLETYESSYPRFTSDAPFVFEEYTQLKDAFNPHTYPETASVLIHVAHRWEGYNAQELTFEVLESLSRSPEYIVPTIAFLDALRSDQMIMTSQTAKQLLKNIEQVLGTKVSKIYSQADIDITTAQELLFAATIANMNSIRLSKEAETVLANHPGASAIYLAQGDPSHNFMSEVISRKDAVVYIALIERIKSSRIHPELGFEDLEKIDENFDEVLKIATAKGHSNSPDEVASRYFHNAGKLNSLYSVLQVAKSQTRNRLNESQTQILDRAN